MAAGVSPNIHVHHQDPLQIESQLQNTQKGVGSLTAERGGCGGDQTKFNIQLALRFFR